MKTAQPKHAKKENHKELLLQGNEAIVEGASTQVAGFSPVIP